MSAGGPDYWCPKAMIELLSKQQTYAPSSPKVQHAIGHLLSVLSLCRPVGSNGKHGDLHTDTCGCEDK
jgi:hypothetical protein